MAEKILNINLNDANSSVIAEILGNKTCKRILGLIAEQTDEGLSETDIAKKLGLAANTVNYNIKKLVKASLIEQTKSFFWSVKGRKIKTYKLANKKIIISTKSSFKGITSSIILTGIMGALIKVIYNSGSIFNFNRVAQKSLDSSLDVVYSAPEVLETGLVADVGTGTLQLPNNLVNWHSILFNDIILWFLGGCLIGLGFYLSYKYLKGGSNKRYGTN